MSGLIDIRAQPELKKHGQEKLSASPTDVGGIDAD
jgi:hypothetical protein